MSSSRSYDKSLTELIRDALVEVYNGSPAGWHEFECAALDALAEMSTEIAKAAAAAEEEDIEMVDADDGNGDEDDDKKGGSSGPGGSGGSGQRNDNGRAIYRCPFNGCGRSYKALRTRTRHIKDKHPNQPVPSFNDL